MKKTIEVFILLFLIAGCGQKHSEKDTDQNLANNTVTIINKSIEDITHEPESWQATLQELSSKLMDESRSKIRNEVHQLTTRTIVAATSENRCDANFLGQRVIEALQRIKANVLNEPIPEYNPVICQVIPSTIDMNLMPNQRNKVEVVGYDFDRQPLRLYLISDKDEKKDFTHAIIRVSHSHLVLNIDSTGVLIQDNSSRLILEFKKEPMYAITIKQPIIPDCIENEITFLPDAITFMPIYTKKGQKFNANDASISTSVDVYIEGNTMKAKVYMKVRETKSNWLVAEGSDIFDIYTTPPDKRFLKIISDKQTTISYRDIDTADDIFEKQDSELIKRFTFGRVIENTGTRPQTRVKLIFNPITVKLKEIGNCQE